MSKHTKQIGSIRTFFIVGIVLTCLLIGSLAFIKNRNDSIQKVENQSTSDTKKDSTKDSTTKNNGPIDTTDNDTNSGSENSTNNSSNSEELPTTGPESTLISALIVFILTVGILEFVNFRKIKNTSFDL